MPDTFTPNLNLDLPPISAYDLFGAKLNANFLAIDAAALRLAGTPLSPTAPTTGQVLEFNGTFWAPGSGGGGVTAVGGTTAIQFANGTAFDGDTNQITWGAVTSADTYVQATARCLTLVTSQAGFAPGSEVLRIVNSQSNPGASIISFCDDGGGGGLIRTWGSIAMRNGGGSHYLDIDGVDFVRLNYNYANGATTNISVNVPFAAADSSGGLTLVSSGSNGSSLTLNGGSSPVVLRALGGIAQIGTGVYASWPVSGAASGVLTNDGSGNLTWAPSGGGAATGLATTGSPVGVGAAAPPTPGQALIATSATTATWQAVTASAAGSDTQVQFNSSGSLGASPNFTFTPSTSHLSIVSASGACLDMDPVNRNFFIARANLIPYGTSVGGVTVQVAGDSADGDNAVFSAKSHGTTSRFWAMHSAGSHASPTPPALGDTMMDVSAIGFTSSWDLYNPGGSMKLVSTAAWSVADHGTSWEVDLCPTTGSTTQYPALFARVTGPSAAQVGVNTATPAYTLDVSGSINFTDDLLHNGQPFLSGFQVTATYAAGITQSFSFPTSLTGGSIVSMTPVDGGSANVAMTGFAPSVPLITGGVGTFTVTYTADPGSAPTVMIIVGGS